MTIQTHRAKTIRPTEHGEYLLACPVCESEHSHHHDVEVFKRVQGEDSDTIVQIPGRAEEGTTSTHGPNPSSRRDAVRIHVEGECGHKWTLDVIQHKGQTLLGVSPTRE